MPPIIALTTYGRHETKVDSIHYDEYFSIPAKYVDAVRRAGGTAVLLPPGETRWADVLKLIDGIIIIGGADIHPSHYDGNAEHPDLTTFDSERDEAELRLAKQLAKTNIPTFAICRGMQVVNVALGGKLHEHIPDIVDKDIHRNAEGGWQLQALEAEAESRLANTMQESTVATYSGHHQAVKDIGEGLKVTACSADGIVEALELENHPWFVAVQWHPEMSAATDETQQRLFDDLVNAAKETQHLKDSL